MKAVFLDRDGVINELVYHQEQGIINSPVISEQFVLLPGVGQAINSIRKNGYKVILVSNQPSIAKGSMTEDNLKNIRQKMKQLLAKEGAFLDAEYYCLHHPDAKISKFKIECECRKPKPGMLIQAAKDMDISLAQSWMIGDGLTDIKAGKDARCKTILLQREKCELCRLMDEKDAIPDKICTSLLEAAKWIEMESEKVRR